jgi:hypothetical protein
MRYIARAAGILIMLAPSATMAGDAAGRPACLDGAWLQELSELVTEWTGTGVPPVCVRRASPRQLSTQLGAIAALGPGEEAGALFLPGSGEILLADDLDIGAALGRSFVVHELVHAQQLEHGARDTSPCAGRLEAEAYAIQARYLNAHGRRQAGFVLELTGMLQGSCGYAYRE